MIQVTENIQWNESSVFELQSRDAQEWCYVEVYPLLCLSKNRQEEGGVVPEWDHLGRPAK
ncbi:MAG: hypothetical protein LUG18_00480 [Candidatus Azobacteroides sp.]|nr:hypothetical protein [Candidatus Azobacteroides sp.]